MTRAVRSTSERYTVSGTGSSSSTGQNCRGRTLATDDGGGRRNQSQDQMRHCLMSALFFTRRWRGSSAATIPSLQACRKKLEASEAQALGCDQRQAVRDPLWSVPETDQAGPRRTGVSGSGHRASGKGPWEFVKASSGRTAGWSATSRT